MKWWKVSASICFKLSNKYLMVPLRALTNHDDSWPLANVGLWSASVILVFSVCLALQKLTFATDSAW